MQLNPDEKKFADKLETAEKNWPKSRFALIFFSILLIIDGIRGASLDKYLFLIATIILVYVYKHWNGRPNIRLLYKIINSLKDK